MKAKDIARIRLANQHLTASWIHTPQELVSWMGALQAQDYAMSKWAVGVRLPGIKEQEVERSLDDGVLLRTHVMRPTWHLVAAADLRWMMDLTGPRIRNSLNANNRALGLTEAVFTKCHKVIGKALSDGAHRTRPELMAELNRSKIDTSGLRGIHIMYRAEVDGMVSSGARRGKENTYALYDLRVPKTDITNREHAVAELVKRYFLSHGPATLQDFSWWSGLSQSDGKAGLEASKELFAKVEVNGQSFWCAAENIDAVPQKSGIFLLPAFDEFMVSYKDRSASLADEHFSNAITINGIFSPIIVADGAVKGTWKRDVKKGHVLLAPAFFGAPSKKELAGVKQAAKVYGAFLGHKVEMASR